LSQSNHALSKPSVISSADPLTTRKPSVPVRQSKSQILLTTD
jgi:hypothetical protein